MGRKDKREVAAVGWGASGRRGEKWAGLGMKQAGSVMGQGRSRSPVMLDKLPCWREGPV